MDPWLLSFCNDDDASVEALLDSNANWIPSVKPVVLLAWNTLYAREAYIRPVT
jgi:hypothetical protein